MQRSLRHIHQARDTANCSLYSPRRAAALCDVTNHQERQHEDLDAVRAAHRNADRARQLSLQETPSRRRRRIPDGRGGQKNRAASPTLGPLRTAVQVRVRRVFHFMGG